MSRYLPPILMPTPEIRQPVIRWFGNRMTMILGLFAVLVFSASVPLMFLADLGPENAVLLPSIFAFPAVLIPLFWASRKVTSQHIVQDDLTYSELRTCIRKHQSRFGREILILLLIVAVIFGLGMKFVFYLYEEHDIKLPSITYVVPVAITFEIFRRLLAYLGKRRKEQLGLADGVILRSFQEESTRVTLGVGFWPIYGPTIETLIATLARPYGSVVSIENPSAILPNYGPSTALVEPDEWQSVALGLIDTVEFIVIIDGPGKGLIWEIEQIISGNHIEKCVLVFPQGPGEVSRYLEESEGLGIISDFSEMETNGKSAIGVVFDSINQPRVIVGSEKSFTNFSYLMEVFFYYLLSKKAHRMEASD